MVNFQPAPTRLTAYQQHPERGITPADVKPANSPSLTVLARYGALNDQGVSHVVN